MRKPGTKVIRLAVVLVIFGAFVAWVAFQPPRQRRAGTPDASVTFLGYTNDASGTRLAMFAVTNLSAFAVARSPKCLMWIAPPGGGWLPHSGVLLPGFPRSRVLRASVSETVTLPPPTTQSPWRISIYVSDEIEPGSTLRRLADAALQRIGLRQRYGATTRQVDSDRIESQK